MSSAAFESLKGVGERTNVIRYSGFVPNSMSPAKPGPSEMAGGIASCFGRGRLPSDLTFLSLRETSTLSLSRHGQHLKKLDSARIDLVIVPGGSRRIPSRACGFLPMGLYDQLIQCAAEQLNQVRRRHSPTLGMDGLHVHLGSDFSAAPKCVRGSLQNRLSPIRDLVRMHIRLLRQLGPRLFSLKKCLCFN
ncbi:MULTISPECIES: hypothetical protein [Mesorhizobium]|uniref:hypothetical protein n=1 Tax=Mesorhizobium TaxID=68287 RepID=UPI001140DB46|nr:MULTISPECIES: hypothetical protein [Mesorhizobium]